MKNNMSSHGIAEIGAARFERAFFDIPEARAIYGGSVAWWRKAVWLRRIPYSKRGSRIVFSRADLESYFQSRRVPARGEIV
jgi:hypothetical protein